MKSKAQAGDLFKYCLARNVIGKRYVLADSKNQFVFQRWYTGDQAGNQEGCRAIFSVKVKTVATIEFYVPSGQTKSEPFTATLARNDWKTVRCTSSLSDDTMDNRTCNRFCTAMISKGLTPLVRDVNRYYLASHFRLAAAFVSQVVNLDLHKGAP